MTVTFRGSIGLLCLLAVGCDVAVSRSSGPTPVAQAAVPAPPPPPPPPPPVPLIPGGAYAPLGPPPQDGVPTGAELDEALAALGPRTPVADVRPVVATPSSQWAWELYHQLAKTNSGNLFYSPQNIAAALALTGAGARGETAAQIARLLHVDPQASNLAEELAQRTAVPPVKQSGCQWSTANRVWGERTEPIRPAYRDAVRMLWDADVALLDFQTQAEAARGEINAWTAAQTNDRIRDLIAPGLLDSSTRLVITSAAYFKSDWVSQFQPARTETAPFHVSADEQVEVPLMRQDGGFLWRQVDDLHVVELPYVGGRFSLIMLLPTQVDGLAALEARLTAAQVASWTSDLQAEEIQLYLPRFTLTTDLSLSEPLRALGMTDAFQADRADFSGLSERPGLVVSEVVHKAFLAIDEQGTEAAAATAVIMLRGPKSPTVVRADHPFIVLIRDRNTNDILFVGRIVRP
ncbi:MAG: serpin family protein [Pirellulales bacterium]